MTRNPLASCDAFSPVGKCCVLAVVVPFAATKVIPCVGKFRCRFRRHHQHFFFLKPIREAIVGRHHIRCDVCVAGELESRVGVGEWNLFFISRTRIPEVLAQAVRLHGGKRLRRRVRARPCPASADTDSLKDGGHRRGQRPVALRECASGALQHPP